MTILLKLTDRGRLLSPSLTEHITERAQKLAHFFGDIQECRVTVDGPGPVAPTRPERCGTPRQGARGRFFHNGRLPS